MWDHKEELKEIVQEEWKIVNYNGINDLDKVIPSTTTSIK